MTRGRRPDIGTCPRGLPLARITWAHPRPRQPRQGGSTGSLDIVAASLAAHEAHLHRRNRRDADAPPMSSIWLASFRARSLAEGRVHIYLVGRAAASSSAAPTAQQHRNAPERSPTSSPTPTRPSRADDDRAASSRGELLRDGTPVIAAIREARHRGHRHHRPAPRRGNRRMPSRIRPASASRLRPWPASARSLGSRRLRHSACHRYHRRASPSRRHRTCSRLTQSAWTPPWHIWPMRRMGLRCIARGRIVHWSALHVRACSATTPQSEPNLLSTGEVAALHPDGRGWMLPSPRWTCGPGSDTSRQPIDRDDAGPGHATG